LEIASKVQEAKKESERLLALLPWQILAELRDHTGFANWKENTDGWGTLEEHCDPSQCAGVTVDDDGEITKIKLGSSNLAGALPDSIGQLSSLKELHCGWNAITAVPASLKALTNLTLLHLQDNPELQLPSGAPLDSDYGDAQYDSAKAVRGFLAWLAKGGTDNGSNASKVQEAKKESERLLPWQILVELYEACGNELEGWDTLEEHRDPSECAGVTVDDSGEITEIDLSDSNLSGKPPPPPFNHLPSYDNQLT
jgi:hypothetical protein